MFNLLVNWSLSPKNGDKQLLDHIGQNITMLKPEQKLYQQLNIAMFPKDLKHPAGIESNRTIQQLNNLQMINTQPLTIQ